MLKSFALFLFLALSFAGCSSKKIKDDQSTPISETSVSSEPMNFNPQGSDSQKIEGLSTIHFDFNKASLNKDEKERLQQNANWIKAHKTAMVLIEGHCDNKGSIEYNLALGERRAKVAMDYLIALGINPKQLSLVSYGKERPLTSDGSDEEQAKNRRDNFVPSQIK